TAIFQLPRVTTGNRCRSEIGVGSLFSKTKLTPAGLRAIAIATSVQADSSAKPRYEKKHDHTSTNSSRRSTMTHISPNHLANCKAHHAGRVLDKAKRRTNRPLAIWDRLEDRTLLSEADLNGQTRLARGRGAEVTRVDDPRTGPNPSVRGRRAGRAAQRGV